jgi:hypothetical protein
VLLGAPSRPSPRGIGVQNPLRVVTRALFPRAETPKRHPALVYRLEYHIAASQSQPQSTRTRGSFVGGDRRRTFLNEQFWTESCVRREKETPAGLTSQDVRPAGVMNGGVARLRIRLCRISGAACARSHIEEIVPHAMLEFGFLQRMMMNHHHVVVA